LKSFGKYRVKERGIRDTGIGNLKDGRNASGERRGRLEERTVVKRRVGKSEWGGVK